MANPEHEEPLDGLDRLTVRLYRVGLALAASGQALVALDFPHGHALCLLGVALAVADLHLYDPRFRWFITAVGVAGLWLSGAAEAPWLLAAGHGLAYVAWAALALKEQLCFRIPGMRVLAGALAILPFLELAGGPVLRLDAALVAGLGGVLALAKARMPLHYDIGDKSAYR